MANENGKSTGTRYTPEQKQDIAKYLKEHSEERGYITAAQKKFGVSYITIRNILGGKTESAKPGPKKNGKKVTGKSDVKGKPGRKPGNASFLRILMGLKKDYTRIGAKIAKMDAALGVK